PKRVSSDVSKNTRWRKREGSRVEPFCRRGIVDRDRKARRIGAKTSVAAARHIDVAAEHSCCQRRARGDAPAAVDLAVSKQCLQRRCLREVALIGAERQFKVVIDIHAVRLIETREPAFGTEIESVLRYSAAATAPGNR